MHRTDGVKDPGGDHKFSHLIPQFPFLSFTEGHIPVCRRVTVFYLFLLLTGVITEHIGLVSPGRIILHRDHFFSLPINIPPFSPLLYRQKPGSFASAFFIDKICNKISIRITDCVVSIQIFPPFIFTGAVVGHLRLLDRDRLHRLFLVIHSAPLPHMVFCCIAKSIQIVEAPSQIASRIADHCHCRFDFLLLLHEIIIRHHGPKLRLVDRLLPLHLIKPGQGADPLIFQFRSHSTVQTDQAVFPVLFHDCIGCLHLPVQIVPAVIHHIFILQIIDIICLDLGIHYPGVILSHLQPVNLVRYTAPIVGISGLSIVRT